MRFPRRSGIIAHPTSFPGRFGCGDLGKAAYQFIDFLVDAGQQIWQILPLGPTGYGDSPYQAFSAFAGNPYLINFDMLVEQGHLTKKDLENVPDFPVTKVDYGWIYLYKFKILNQAAYNFQNHIHGEEIDAFQRFCEEHKSWLDDYALFAAVKDAHNGKLWTEWDKNIALHQPEAVQSWTHKLSDAIFARKYQQYQFFRQWLAVKEYANNKRISIMGDIPIYVALDSADAWANSDLYKFDENGRPTVVAGVPPDYFSKTGQLWGNPIYRWDVHQSEGYTWWIDRFQHTLKTVDIIRIDHFRGFESYWEVPAGDKTAENGVWQKGPGTDLFHALENALGELPIIAEDLGLITKDVEALRDELGFPGMAVLQFAFGGDAANTHLPHNFKQNMAVYTGTHDNDTTIDWFTAGGGTTMSKKQIEDERDYVRRYFATDGWEIHWTMIRALLASVADTAIIPLQDVLGLGAEARMNTPGKAEGNWQWRYKSEQLDPNLSARLKEKVVVYGRTLVKKKEG